MRTELGSVLVLGVLLSLTIPLVSAGDRLAEPPHSGTVQDLQDQAETGAQDARQTAGVVKKEAAGAQREAEGTGQAAVAQAQSTAGTFVATLRDFVVGLLPPLPTPPGVGTDPGTAAPGPASAKGGAVVASSSEAETVGLVLVMAAGAAGAALLWLAVLQRSFVLGLVPLLSRIAHSEIYNNDSRRLVGDIVSQTPGLSLNEIVSKTGFSRNAVSYHLFVLEKEEELVSVKDGKYRRYFARQGKYVNGAKNVVSVLRNETTLKIAQRIAVQPGTIQRDLCALLGTTASAVCWHIKRLEELGVVRKQRVANTVQYYPGGAVEKYDLSEFGLPRASAPVAVPLLTPTA